MKKISIPALSDELAAAGARWEYAHQLDLDEWQLEVEDEECQGCVSPIRSGDGWEARRFGDIWPHRTMTDAMQDVERRLLAEGPRQAELTPEVAALDAVLEKLRPES